MSGHKEALLRAMEPYWMADGHSLPDSIVDELVHETTEVMKAYIEARGLVIVPKEATKEMRVAGESWSFLPDATWCDMIDASPDPLAEGGAA